MKGYMERGFATSSLVPGQNLNEGLFDRGSEKMLVATRDLLYNVDMHDD